MKWEKPSCEEKKADDVKLLQKWRANGGKNDMFRCGSKIIFVLSLYSFSFFATVSVAKHNSWYVTGVEKDFPISRSRPLWRRRMKGQLSWCSSGDRFFPPSAGRAAVCRAGFHGM